ncbi:Omp28-related outer membrane protein [Flavobacterium chungnamense]|uniref:Outer membrane protein Omp28 n=1 Tax=Flavobacterium chungnamense TaxID=706182 RepID=A0ABP7V174_9FLAO
MKNFKFLSFLLAASFFISCSKDDSSDSGSNQPPAVDNTPISGQFQKRVLVEDYTGAWCGYCPRVAYGIEKVLEQSTKVVPVAIHQQSGSGYDPYHFAGATPLKTLIDLQGYPTGKLNRMLTWSYPENSNINQVKNLALNNVGLGLALNSTVSGGNINLDVKIKFAKDYTNLKLVVYVLENNLIYDQVNYTSFYGGGSVISNFEHDNVLRDCRTNILGDAITENTTNGQTITKNFTFPIPASVSNAANLSFVAFVVDGADNKAINVRGALPNENQQFEINP